LALGEVLLAFALAHLAFRAFRRFTLPGRLEVEAGWVFSPGLALAAAACLAIALRRRRLADHGLHLRGALPAAWAGLVAAGVLAIGGVLAFVLGIEVRPAALGPRNGPLLFAGELLATAATLFVLSSAGPRSLREPRAWTPGLLLLLVLLPTALALVRGATFGPVLMATLWRFFGAGCGEEIFFRGYVQTRLDEAFGRPWRWFGVGFGPGLVFAALLFGLVHLLNPFDYFGTSRELAWWHGLATVAMPYGFLFARTGSVVAPAVLHGLVDVLMLVHSARVGG
jgi:membrane protease YdiL (CAAX protease family)